MRVGLRYPFELAIAKVAECKGILREPPGLFADYDFAGTSHFLKAGCEVRSVADDSFLLCGAFANQVAHDDETSRNANASGERRVAAQSVVGQRN